MIFSKFEELGVYKGINPNLDIAIDYLQTADKSNLQVGRFPISGDDIYALVSEYNTRSLDEGKYETHKKYLDIQCLIEGSEHILVAEKQHLISSGYDEATDKEHYADGTEEVCVTVSPERALILFPHDAHKACCMIDNRRKAVKKLLLKVKI